MTIAMEAARDKRQMMTLMRHIKHDDLVLEAIKKLGGNIHMRVMDFRKHLAEPLRESEIKDSLKRLVELGRIEMLYEHGGHGKRMRLL